MGGFNINITPEYANFGAGLATGWGTAFILYRSRHLMAAVRDRVTDRADQAQEYATRSADARYLNELHELSESMHLAGNSIKLSDVLVEPQFIKPPELAAPPDDDVLHNVFHVVPVVPDHPYLHAPYNVETLALSQLDNGERAIALLGLPGSGRTTALQAIALWSMGHINFSLPPDIIQQRLEDEDQDEEIDAEERAQRIKDRLQIQEMAQQSLARKKGEEVDDDNEEQFNPDISLFRLLTPVYTHLANVADSLKQFRRKVDPAEPLVRALQYYVGRVTSRTLPRNLYERLGEGKVLLLLDGFDDLSPDEQPQIINWLQALIAQYKHNFIIVTGPASGYGPLVNAGLSPVHLRPWSDVQAKQAADTWANAWPDFYKNGRQKVAEPPEDLVNQAKTNTRVLSPFDLTLKIWGIYADPEQKGYEYLMRTLLSQYLSSNDIDDLLPKLILAASLQLDEGYITTLRLEELDTGVSVTEADSAAESSVDDEEEELADAESVFGSSEPIGDYLEEDVGDEDEMDRLDSLFGEDTIDDIDEAELEAATAAEGEDSEAEAEAEEEVHADKEHVRLINLLHKSGLLIQYRGNRYQFNHPLIAAYLASLSLAEMSVDVMLEKAYTPAWQQALAYASSHTPVGDIVDERLNAPADVLRNNLLETSRWLAYADRKVSWRATILRQLGNMLVASNQYLLVRERVAAALIGTHDKNALRIFQRALQHPNSDVRRLACLGVGALGSDDAIEQVADLLIDEETDVSLAAGLSLGAINSEAALEEMLIGFTDGTEELRQAIAEAFAAIPDEGYPVLYDAIQHEDMMLRRAAVFGLRRVNAPWALIALYRTSLEDDQWYVRSAAETAFQEMHYGDQATGVVAYPPVDEIPWLREWVMELGAEAAQEEGQEEGQSPTYFLLKAIDEGDSLLQTLSILNIGQLGLVEHTNILYRALRHQEETVRDAAHQALSNLQLQMGQPLPSPV